MQGDKRRWQLENWLQKTFQDKTLKCEPASSDASFRRYFRIVKSGKCYVVMDAPPDKEDCEPFVRVAQTLRSHEIQAPKIFHRSEEDGFLVLSDFGSICYLDELTSKTVDKLYRDAIEVLHKMHQIQAKDDCLPSYNDELLSSEMGLFKSWFLEQLLDLSLSDVETKGLENTQAKLSKSATEQPQVFVHRDYHSRNLMVTAENNPGVIDFQDAVYGPLTYDLVSLLRDCYLSWPDEKVYAWLDAFLAERKARGFADDFDSSQFYMWFDWMGVQRHMKAVGIFSRLLIRDGKSNYLQDIPRTLNYISQACCRYQALAPLSELIENHNINERMKQVLLEKGLA
ncbi:MAG: phosphotransferase [Cycloclasticus sp. symbiont of Poecilosclerida sp. M]|nr:MAG: phosphotransferase [Cycloclasticus sp. symbiont of Poecilosclerida sp. M]